MTVITSFLLTLVLASSGSSPDSPGGPTDAFSAIDLPYQSIRLALLEDSTRGVQGWAAEIAKAATALKDAPTAARAGVAEADLEAVSGLLPEVIERSRALAELSEIGAQREAMKALTRPLVRWHEKLSGGKTRLAYCPMERGAWFQPDGVLGNPYGGTRMPRCGSFVTE